MVVLVYGCSVQSFLYVGEDLVRGILCVSKSVMVVRYVIRVFLQVGGVDFICVNILWVRLR